MLPDGSPASRTRTAALSCVVLEPVMPWRQTVPPACRHSVLSLAAAASREVGATRSQPGTATSPPEHSRQPGPSRRNVGGLDPPTRLHRLRAVRPESSRPAPPGLPVFTLPSAAALLPANPASVRLVAEGNTGRYRPQTHGTSVLAPLLGTRTGSRSSAEVTLVSFHQVARVPSNTVPARDIRTSQPQQNGDRRSNRSISPARDIFGPKSFATHTEARERASGSTAASCRSRHRRHHRPGDRARQPAGRRPEQDRPDLQRRVLRGLRPHVLTPPVQPEAAAMTACRATHQPTQAVARSGITEVRTTIAHHSRSG